jgi:glutamate-1-semialdehyde aminotransferase
VLSELEKGHVYPHINHLAERLQKGLTEIGARLGFEMLVNRAASFFQIHFGIKEIRNKRDQLKADKKTADLFHFGLRAHGVMASYHPLFMSAAHTEVQIEHVLEVAETVLIKIK